MISFSEFNSCPVSRRCRSALESARRSAQSSCEPYEKYVRSGGFKDAPALDIPPALNPNPSSDLHAEGPINANMRVVSVDDNPERTALLYVCGTYKHEPATILCEDVGMVYRN